MAVAAHYKALSYRAFERGLGAPLPVDAAEGTKCRYRFVHPSDLTMCSEWRRYAMDEVSPNLCDYSTIHKTLIWCQRGYRVPDDKDDDDDDDDGSSSSSSMAVLFPVAEMSRHTLAPPALPPTKPVPFLEREDREQQQRRGRDNNNRKKKDNDPFGVTVSGSSSGGSGVPVLAPAPAPVSALPPPTPPNSGAASSLLLQLPGTIATLAPASLAATPTSDPTPGAGTTPTAGTAPTVVVATAASKSQTRQRK